MNDQPRYRSRSLAWALAWGMAASLPLAAAAQDGGPQLDPAGPAATAPPTSPPAPEEPGTRRASAHDYLRAGDDAFARDDFAAAELEYRRALDRESSFRASYNLGVALARQGRAEEAAEAFARARSYADADAEGDLADASYNAGNAHAEADDLQAAIEDYVAALRANPEDREAKENLANALRQLRRQQQQQQQQQSGGEEGQSGESEDSDGEEEGEPRDQSGDEPRESDGEPSGEESAEQPEVGAEPQDGREGDEPTQPESPTAAGGTPSEAADVNREEAERLLELARDRERRTQEKVKLGERTDRDLDKDW